MKLFSIHISFPSVAKKSYIGLLLSLVFVLLSGCASTSTRDSEGYIYVYNVEGVNKDDLELNAKRKILENGLGDLIEGSSQAIDGQLKEKIINSSTEGYVTNYTQIGEIRKKGIMLEIDAKGKVNKKAIGEALKERYKDIGKPSFLMVIDEKVLGKSNSGNSVTITENAIAGKFSEFDFLDRNQFTRILAKEGGKSIGVYGNPSSEEKVLAAAAEMEAQILLVGQTDVASAGEIENSGLKSYQATLRFKIFDVNSARIIASDNSAGAHAHINPETGAQEAIGKAVDKAYPKIRDQVASKWKPGTIVRVKIEGMSYDEFIDKDVRTTIRNIKGVNGVNDKNSGNVNNMIVFEVEALFNGNALYQKMRDRKSDFGFDFSSKEVKPSTIHIVVKK
jgi:hypothetical protein